MSATSLFKRWSIVTQSGVSCGEQAGKGLKVTQWFYFSAYHYCFPRVAAGLHVAIGALLLNRKDFLNPPPSDWKEWRSLRWDWSLTAVGQTRVTGTRSCWGWTVPGDLCCISGKAEGRGRKHTRFSPSSGAVPASPAEACTTFASRCTYMLVFADSFKHSSVIQIMSNIIQDFASKAVLSVEVQGIHESVLILTSS